ATLLSSLPSFPTRRSSDLVAEVAGPHRASSFTNAKIDTDSDFFFCHNCCSCGFGVLRCRTTLFQQLHITEPHINFAHVELFNICIAHCSEDTAPVWI